MLKAANAIFTAFEIANEMYTAIGAGLLGIVVLVQHGFKSNQTFRTAGVAALTIASFLYASRQLEKSKPSKKKIVFITGCDSGLGFSLAQHISDLGFTVIASFLNLQSKGALEIRRIYGKDILQIQLDVRNSDNVKYAVKTVENYIERYEPNGEFYCLINNAGVMNFGEFEWLTENLIQQHLDVNLCGTFKVTKAFCPLLRQYKGRVLTITSHCAQACLPGLAVYGATKAGLAAWSDGIRVELGKYGVNVVNFIPGSFPTESGIMSKQLQNVQEMHEAFTAEQHDFYNDYFKRYNIYLSYIATPCDPKKLEDVGMYETFNNALLDVRPDAVYKHEPFRYAVYHFIFRFSPTTYLRDYFVTKFMQMPAYKRRDIKL